MEHKGYKNVLYLDVKATLSSEARSLSVISNKSHTHILSHLNSKSIYYFSLICSTLSAYYVSQTLANKGLNCTLT